jgi:hypothetical protein
MEETLKKITETYPEILIEKSNEPYDETMMERFSCFNLLDRSYNLNEYFKLMTDTIKNFERYKVIYNKNGYKHFELNLVTYKLHPKQENKPWRTSTVHSRIHIEMYGFIDCVGNYCSSEKEFMRSVYKKFNPEYLESKFNKYFKLLEKANEFIDNETRYKFALDECKLVANLSSKKITVIGDRYYYGSYYDKRSSVEEGLSKFMTHYLINKYSPFKLDGKFYFEYIQDPIMKIELYNNGISDEYLAKREDPMIPDIPSLYGKKPAYVCGIDY